MNPILHFFSSPKLIERGEKHLPQQESIEFICKVCKHKEKVTRGALTNLNRHLRDHCHKEVKEW